MEGHGRSWKGRCAYLIGALKKEGTQLRLFDGPPGGVISPGAAEAIPYDEKVGIELLGEVEVEALGAVAHRPARARCPDDVADEAI